MINNETPFEIVIFDSENLKKKCFKVYNDVTLEIRDGIISRIISPNKSDIIKYYNLIGSKNSI